MNSVTWHGHERRRQLDRRISADRREDIRFEPGKPDRRRNRGRREEDRDFWVEALQQE